MRVKRSELKRVLGKLRDFSTKFPMLKQEDINKKELAKAISEEHEVLEIVFWFMNKQQEEDIYLEDINKIIKKQEKITIEYRNGEQKKY